MSRGSTLFLKGVVVLVGIAALAGCAVALPIMASKDAAAHPETAYMRYPFLAGSYALAVPFFIAMIQAFNLLSCIERNRAFTDKAVRALKLIRYSAITICAIIVLGVLSIMLFIHDEDITPFITLGIVGMFATSIIATFAALLIKVLQHVIAFKIENDLTI
ncbi:DUF2975 domain-containing protein [Paenibacillus aurantiacus]|uniref:DUF2975 domain-containing protein n=1 Tax=Paenibacillus aurantiacus TaxID=1936118 RepID=A0ABV5KU04_9BACL